MNHFQDDLEQRFALQQAIEARFGKPSSWSLKIQAAYAQLETMQRLMGDDYSPFIQLAQQAIRRHRERPSRLLGFRRGHLGLLMHPDGHATITSAEFDLGWALNLSLEILLDDQQYEALIEAAIEALELVPADAN